jgi:hypothetical protein
LIDSSKDNETTSGLAPIETQKHTRQYQYRFKQNKFQHINLRFETFNCLTLNSPSSITARAHEVQWDAMVAGQYHTCIAVQGL